MNRNSPNLSERFTFSLIILIFNPEELLDNVVFVTDAIFASVTLFKNKVHPFKSFIETLE